MALPFSTSRGACNICKYSQQLDQWPASAVTYVANAVTTTVTTYDRIAETVANDYHVASLSTLYDTSAAVNVGRTFTYSAKLKDETRRYAILRVGDGVQGYMAIFDLTTGVVSGESNAYGYTRRLNDGGYLCWITFSLLSVGTSLGPQVAMSNDNASYHSYVGDTAKTFLAADMQLVEGDVPGEVTVTGATQVNPTSTVNVRRVNKIPYSEDFTNGWWAANTGVTLTSPSTDVPAPWPGAIVNKIAYNSTGVAGSYRFYETGQSGPANIVYTQKIWLRTSSGTVSLRLGDNQSPGSPFTVTTVWQPFTLTSAPWTTAAAVNQLLIYSPAADNSAFTVYATAAQGVIGTNSGDYIKTVGRAINRTRVLRQVIG